MIVFDLIRSTFPSCLPCSSRAGQCEEGASAENKSFSSSARNLVNKTVATLDIFLLILDRCVFLLFVTNCLTFLLRGTVWDFYYVFIVNFCCFAGFFC